MDKFVTSIKQNTTENQDEYIPNEKKKKLILEDSEIIQQKDNNEYKFYLINIYI